MAEIIDKAVVTIMDDGTTSVEHLVENVHDEDVMKQKIKSLEKFLKTLPNAREGNDACPLKHHFVDGIYMRSIFNPKGMLIVTKTHKTNHPFFLMNGDITIITAKGSERIVAPYYGFTEAGTKRVIFANEDSVFVTVHPNPTEEKDIDKLEDVLIDKEADRLPEAEQAEQLEGT